MYRGHYHQIGMQTVDKETLFRREVLRRYLEEKTTYQFLLF